MSEKIDFVGLIEKNPLTRLSGNYCSLFAESKVFHKFINIVFSISKTKTF